MAIDFDTLDIKQFQEQYMDSFITKCELNTDSGCIEWIRGTSSDGYGRFSCYGVNINAHVVAYILFNEVTPEKGMHVHHICENRLCVNVAHLEVVTPQVNVQETSKNHLRGRHMTSEQVIDLRRKWQKGHTVRQLREEFNIDGRSVRRIANGEAYKKLPLFPRSDDFDPILRGNKSKMSKISDGDVIEIRRLYHEVGLVPQEISPMFDISPKHAADIAHNRKRYDPSLPITEGNRSRRTKNYKLKHADNLQESVKGMYKTHTKTEVASHFNLTKDQVKYICRDIKKFPKVGRN